MKGGKLFLVLALWVAAAVGDTWYMVSSANGPGEAGDPPSRWPAKTALAHTPGTPVLVMFVHPHCPCSRASLAELETLLAHTSTPLTAHVVMLKPEATGEEWDKSELWRKAAAIDGLNVTRDDAGHEAQAFGSLTSGDAVLYDAAGRLAYHGGITLARGHLGDNPGRNAVETLLAGQSAPGTEPVFGCALFQK